MKKVIVLSVMLLLSVVSFSQQKESAIHDVSSEEFKKVMDSMGDEVVVDLRTPEETSKGKIPGAIEMDFYGSGFKPSIAALDRNKVYLVYCAGGKRSGETAALMQEMGFRNIYNLEDGYNGWVKDKMPVVKK
ncbi:MAG: rhodanese-like domain-containing protein [Chryseosolibacter sp.]